MSAYSVIGKRLPRVDGPIKVTGEAKFIVDIRRPVMLHAKVLRSPLPHARILNIDTSRAERLPGIRAMLTPGDTPKTKFSSMEGVAGATLADRSILAVEKVRYIGELFWMEGKNSYCLRGRGIGQCRPSLGTL